MSLLWSFRDLVAASSYKYCAPTELKSGSDDNPPKLMYKGNAKQNLKPSNCLCLTHPHLNTNLILFAPATNGCVRPAPESLSTKNTKVSVTVSFTFRAGRKARISREPS